MKQYKNLLGFLRTSTAASAIALAFGAAMAQGPMQGAPSTPRADQPNQGGGGGMGIGINIALDSVINALKSLNKNDEPSTPEVKESARNQFAQALTASGTAEQFVRRLCEQHKTQSTPRKPPVTAASSKKPWQCSAPQGNTCKVNGDFEAYDFTA